MESSVHNQQWVALSQALANVIENLSGSIVAVHGGVVLVAAEFIGFQG